MQYPPTSDSSGVPAPPPGYVTSDESSRTDRPAVDQCQARSVLGHGCWRPADVTLSALDPEPRALPANYCLLHVFGYLTVAVEMDLDGDVLTIGALT